jgi:hypothetical protein
MSARKYGSNAERQRAYREREAARKHTWQQRQARRMPAQVPQKLVKILGMLGSAHAGERAAAAFQATALLNKLGLMWHEVLNVADEEADD